MKLLLEKGQTVSRSLGCGAMGDEQVTLDARAGGQTLAGKPIAKLVVFISKKARTLIAIQ